MPNEQTANDRAAGVTRRRLLASAGVAGAGLGSLGYLAGRETGETTTAATSIPFYGAHQAGITTSPQASLHFAAFDLEDDSAASLRELLRAWSDAGARLVAGRSVVGGVDRTEGTAAVDSGEALGLGPARLTLTIGLGPSLFDLDGEDRLGLKAQQPRALRPLPPLPGDQLEPGRSGGDLCIQACADDPQVAFHAIHNLGLAAAGIATPRWAQIGFGRASSTSRAQPTPRNLMGFKDGTNNIHADETEAMTRYVWVAAEDGPRWMRSGTYMVTRRIRMLLDVWDGLNVQQQEQTIGRHKVSGAPLGRTAEFDPADLRANRGGVPAIPNDAHIRLAAPQNNHGERILRRGYSYADGVDPQTRQLDAGLFFICFQRDPERQFVAIQRRLGLNDALTRHISHTSSALFASPPGARRGGFVGDGLFSRA